MEKFNGMKALDIFVAVLLIIGGINWGLVGFFNFNLVAALFGATSAISRVIYAFVGLAALYEIGCYTFGFKAILHRWCDMPFGVRH